jgi:cyclohexanecarboxylate-CoA ligase
MTLVPTALRPEDAARYRDRGFWPGIPLANGFERTCAARGHDTALVEDDARLSFAEWGRLTSRAAVGLLSLGIAPGDVVSYQLPNWWEAAVLFLAAARVGAVVNPVPPTFRERELSFILRQSGASLLVVPGEFRGCDHPALVGRVRAGLPALSHVLVVRGEPPAGMRSFAAFLETPWERAPQTADRLVRAVDPESVAMLMYTSGTTADPKGVLHTHNTLTAEVRSLQRVHDLSPRDATLMPSPLTHVSGVIHAMLTPALLGTRAVLMERWDAARGLELLERERVTYMVGAPTFLRDLAAHPGRPARHLSAFRLFSCGGAGVSADLVLGARAALGCVAKRVYGSTEFPTITTTDATDAETMGVETEGRPIWPAEVRVVGDDGRPVAAAAEGEIEARGPECFVGYVDPALNADSFTPDGWFRTGDLGSIDAGGYLRITGRSKDIVIRKGEKFSVRELEELIERHPAVAAVAVVAVTDERSGERACAAVSLREGAALSLEELCEFLRGRGLARQKMPEQLLLLAELPRTDSGKPDRGALRRLATERT